MYDFERNRHLSSIDAERFMIARMQDEVRERDRLARRAAMRRWLGRLTGQIGA